MKNKTLIKIVSGMILWDLGLHITDLFKDFKYYPYPRYLIPNFYWGSLNYTLFWIAYWLIAVTISLIANWRLKSYEK